MTGQEAVAAIQEAEKLHSRLADAEKLGGETLEKEASAIKQVQIPCKPCFMLSLLISCILVR